MKQIKITLTSFMVVLLVGSAAFALTATPGYWNYGQLDGYWGHSPSESYDGADNSFSNVKVDEMYDVLGYVDGKDSDENLLDSSWGATGLAAFFEGVDNPLPKINIGEENDGLLNGYEDGAFALVDAEGNPVEKDGVPIDYYFNGYEFLYDSDFQDLDGDGEATDPGWIHLGKFDTTSDDFTYGYVGGEDGGIPIGDLITIKVSWSETGENATWTLTPTKDILEILQPELGSSFFDHLAIALKAGTYFAIYDLDFNKIFNLAELGAENFVPLELSGTLNNYNFDQNNNGAPGISHISFWAHDPTALTVVPEPATLILLGSGLLGLGISIRRRKKQNQ